VLEKLRAADDMAVVYSDVPDFIDRENELASGLRDERRYIAQTNRGKRPLKGLLRVPLFPYRHPDKTLWPYVRIASDAASGYPSLVPDERYSRTATRAIKYYLAARFGETVIVW